MNNVSDDGFSKGTTMMRSESSMEHGMTDLLTSTLWQSRLNVLADVTLQHKSSHPVQPHAVSGPARHPVRRGTAGTFAQCGQSPFLPQAKALPRRQLWETARNLCRMPREGMVSSYSCHIRRETRGNEGWEGKAAGASMSWSLLGQSERELSERPDLI